MPNLAAQLRRYSHEHHAAVGFALQAKRYAIQRCLSRVVNVRAVRLEEKILPRGWLVPEAEVLQYQCVLWPKQTGSVVGAVVITEITPAAAPFVSTVAVFSRGFTVPASETNV